MPRMSPHAFMSEAVATEPDVTPEVTKAEHRQAVARDRIAALKRFRSIMADRGIDTMPGTVSLLRSGWETGVYRFGTMAGPCEAWMDYGSTLISILIQFDDPQKAIAARDGWHIPRWSVISETSGKWNEHALPDAGPEVIAYMLDLFEILLREMKASPPADRDGQVAS